MVLNLSIMVDIESYIDKINNDWSSKETTEHSFRGYLQELLNNLLNQGIKNKTKKITIINEPTRKDYGAPDFEFRRNDVAVSFLETKKIGDPDLLGGNDKQHKEQFDRYKKAVNLIAFTDYLNFHLFENGQLKLSAIIGKNENGIIVVNNDEQQLSNFLKIVSALGNAEPQPIRSATLLAETMANKGKIIAEILDCAMLKKETNEDKELHEKLDAFKKFLVHDMTIEQFSDFYSQTILYGLFVARVYDKSPETFTLQEAADLIPAINPFLKKIFKQLALADLHGAIKWVVEDLVSIFRVTDMNRVMHNYGKDPLVHFYEDFLEAYNPKIREDYGVWYTPEEVVRFMVNAVDTILREKLGIEKGLADKTRTTYKNRSLHQVQILDPATGTGTFLAITAEKIYDSYKGKEGMWPEDVVNEIIPRLIGFEYLMAPYTMAHLKVATALHLDEIKDNQPERLQIFLTNSLEEDHPEEKLEFAKFITDESNAASIIKRDTPVMVVMGNPPYNEKSANNGEWITDLMDAYKQEPGKTRINLGFSKKKNKNIYKNTLEGEKNPKGINNDYCKFIRLGQKFVEETGSGVLAYICANTFLDTSLFRGMRYELLHKFDEIYIINLHGSNKRNESTENIKDECVFNIKVGVSINIFIKHKDVNDRQQARVFYKDIFGTQKEKLQYLSNHVFKDIDFLEIIPSAPFYTFKNRSKQLREQYDSGFNIRELMNVNVQGFTTDKDNVAIKYEKEGIEDIVNAMLSDKDDAELKDEYGFSDSRDWNLAKGRALIKAIDNKQDFISRVCYRPFDECWTFFHKALVTYPRPLLQSSVHNRNNIVLCLGKEGNTIGDKEWSLVYCSTLPTDKNVIPRGGAYLFPLYVYDQTGIAHTNFSNTIITQLEEKTSLYLQPISDTERLKGGFLAIDLFDYIYAILHSSRYRTIYHECLQDGFPSIPYPTSADYFYQIAELGKRMRNLHLLLGISEQDISTTYPEWRSVDNNLCEIHKFKETRGGFGQVWINKQQYFDNVPIEAWNMVVSGYQPLDRWLKDRKGKKLTNDEIEHYQKMIVALEKQSELMKEIDRTIVL